MLGILTKIIGVVARGKAAKAIAGGGAGAIVSVLTTNDVIGKVWDAFAGGATEAIVPQAHDLGFQLATAVTGYVVGHVITWLSPANKPA